MFTKEFDFDLPPELIAQKPSQTRGGDRLLVLNKKTGRLEDKMFCDLPEVLPKNALMVFIIQRCGVHGFMPKAVPAQNMNFY